MRVKNNIHFLVIVIAGCIALNSCITYKDVEFKGVNDVNIGDIKNQLIPIELNVKIYNPNNYNIKITKANLDIYLEGKHFGQSNAKKNIVIKKNEENDYSIVLETSKSKIGQSIFSTLSMLLGKNLTIEVKGTVTAKAFGIKKKFPISEKHQLKPSDFM